MKKPLFIDTSYILALVNSHDQFHSQAQALADRVDNKLITTEAVLTEIGNALARLKWREIAVGVLQDLQDDVDVKVLSVDRELFSRSLKLYASRADKEWGITDCMSFTVMNDYHLTDALTTDRHFEQAGYNALLLKETD